MRIFGREPAALIAALQAAVGLLVVLDVLDWSTDQVSLVMAAAAAVLGVLAAAATRDTMLGYVIAAVNAFAALIVGFGFDLSADVTAGIIALITVLSGYFQRTQTSPAPALSLASNG